MAHAHLMFALDPHHPQHRLSDPKLQGEVGRQKLWSTNPGGFDRLPLSETVEVLVDVGED